MTLDEIDPELAQLIQNATDPADAAEIAFEAMIDFSDREMGDGDTARAVAKMWLAKFRYSPQKEECVGVDAKQQDCGHPRQMRSGEGSISADGSSYMSWRCGACGKSEIIRTPPRS